MQYVRRLIQAPTPEVLAARELDEARRALLEAQSAAEYADSMIAYHSTRVERLTDFLANTPK